MANPYRGGTADSWYSGKRDLWIEWKWVELPKRPDTIIDITHGTAKSKPSLSVLQQHWIRDRVAEGRDVWVIVGCKDGGLVTMGGWPLAMSRNKFSLLSTPREGIARFILNHCNP